MSSTRLSIAEAGENTQSSQRNLSASQRVLSDLCDSSSVSFREFRGSTILPA
jgi:hypothetical protein